MQRKHWCASFFFSLFFSSAQKRHRKIVENCLRGHLKANLYIYMCMHILYSIRSCVFIYVFFVYLDKWGWEAWKGYHHNIHGQDSEPMVRGLLCTPYFISHALPIWSPLASFTVVCWQSDLAGYCNIIDRYSMAQFKALDHISVFFSHLSWQSHHRVPYDTVYAVSRAEGSGSIKRILWFLLSFSFLKSLRKFSNAERKKTLKFFTVLKSRVKRKSQTLV